MHLDTTRPHTSDWSTFNYTLRVGRSTLTGSFFAPDDHAARSYLHSVIVDDMAIETGKTIRVVSLVKVS